MGMMGDISQNNYILSRENASDHEPTTRHCSLTIELHVIYLTVVLLRALHKLNNVGWAVAV